MLNPIKPKLATQAQRWALLSLHKISPIEGDFQTMTREEASSIIAWHAKHWRRYPPTQRQEIFLRNWGQWDENLSRGQACDMIGEIKARIATMTPDERERTMVQAQRKAAGFDW